MAGRGRSDLPRLPPMDPSLQTRPVPRSRQFSVRSYGPGADADILQTATSLKALDVLTGYKPLSDLPETEDDDELDRYIERREAVLLRHKMRNFLEEVESMGRIDWRDEGTFEDDPTWGLQVIVTSYTEAALDNLDAALSTLIRAVDRYFLQQIDSFSETYVLELNKRFKLDLILDKEVLEDATNDRVREEFNAHVRHLRFFPLGKEDSIREGKFNRPKAPTPRFLFCICLDESKILELSSAEFPTEVGEDQEALQDLRVKLIFRYSNYPEHAHAEDIRHSNGVTTYFNGVDWCPIWKIPLIYAYADQLDDASQMFPMTNYEPYFY